MSGLGFIDHSHSSKVNGASATPRARGQDAEAPSGSGVGEGHQRYLEATESSMEVVEGQYAVVDCQKAKEPGSTDQQKEQKGAAEGPAVRTRGGGGTQEVRQGQAGLT